MKNETINNYTGLPCLDEILKGVRLGDNVVLQVDSIDDYIKLVHPFAREAYKQKRELIYFHFADHQAVLPDDVEAHVYNLKPEDGFENFISEIFTVIEKYGKGAFYVFDCLSELAVDWYSDRMLGNFFMLNCPYLYDYDTVAYFALLRNRHTAFAVDAIRNTAQVVLDVYRHKDELYIHPLKVDERHSSTMYMLHRWEEDKMVPVTKSTITAGILSSVPQTWLDFTMQRPDIWTHTFSQAQEIVNTTRFNQKGAWKGGKLFDRLLRMSVTRDPSLLKLASKYFDLTDIVDIGKRMIGTGLIGGKSVGMLLARSILRKKDPKWTEKLEPHDSFFIGSDVFYTYLIENKCWWMRRKLKTMGGDFEGAKEVQERLLAGEFPKDIQDQFSEMLNYFGQSPIIVRSSSLLEDAYGNAFSGKYESVFCANQGAPEERLETFMAAVREVYASTMSKEALAYREHWDLLDRDEQMAILVQRVSGEVYGEQFFPQIAGVGFSFNPYVWNSDIDPEAGMLRLVFGLGTRAVDNVDDDYTRLVALNAPMKRPESSSDDVSRYTQRHVDVLDLKDNCYAVREFEQIAKAVENLPIQIFASRDQEVERRAREHGMENVFSWILTFETLLSKTNFVKDMAEMMRVVKDCYDHHVDIEFTVNFLTEDEYQINLVQCRPFQVKGNILSVASPEAVAREDILLESQGPVIGSSRATIIDRIIYVVPEIYGKMKMSDRYAVARLIGRLTHIKKDGKRPTIMLVGPGRWATTSPSLGVPVSFAEINTVSVLCEVAAMHDGLVPEVSLGTHFFNDLVEMDMLYMAVYPHKYDNVFSSKRLEQEKNLLPELLPEEAVWEKAVRVIDSPLENSDVYFCLNADVLKQNALCYLGKKSASESQITSLSQKDE